ncbi:uncharacterized protein B0H18DRAFT_872176 [Fomitopsis serialis]|uniref:uncharacterized protein n=1 Tax=Fomitopsis serialis TaxID=139415 RepID=UPI002008B325|nr:uncharacterized protein B0H18DRAFT_872176 [Neoantrodia serialis]KAH9931480.1 hypothetical protein B0H18DRAFT_872176 [Neoantrodia serialis]
MKRGNHKSPFRDVPSRAEVAQFDPRRGRLCCTDEDFRFDVVGTPRSPWNLSAADVFTQSFMAKHPGLQKEDVVRSAWIRHSQRLREQYQDQMKDPAALASQQSHVRQQERKRTLFAQRRAITVYVLSDIEPRARDLVDALGVHGMSSDESDHELGEGQATYFIKNVKWRSPALLVWLRELDSLHLWVRYRAGFSASEGNWPHFRVDGRRNSLRPPIRGLPKNCYAATLNFDEFQMKWLKPISQDIALMHRQDVRE